MPWRSGSPARLAVLLAAGLLLAHPTLAADPGITIGFKGYVKTGQWFPVTVAPFPDGDLRAVSVMRRDYCGNRATAVARFGLRPDSAGGGWRGLARLPDGYGRAFLRCEFGLPGGAARVVDTPLDSLDASDLLVAAVSDRPADFEFLGSVERGGRRVARCAAGGPGLLRHLPWQALQALDTVILDGPAPAGPAESAALRDWVVMGGTVVLTERAIRGGSAWGLAPEGVSSRGVADLSGDKASWLLDSRVEALRAFKSCDAALPGFIPLVPVGEISLVAARAFGRGRVIAVGVDWESFDLRDRAMYETLRRAFWTRVLDLRQTGEVPDLSRDVAVPREAQVRFLMWPLLGFLGLCCLVLGPVNWLSLARLRRLEYTVVTIPAGAAVLALAAFGVGRALRTADVVVTDREVSVTGADGYTWSTALSGVLSPSSRRHAVSVGDPRVQLGEHSARRYGTVEADPLLVASFADEGMRIGGVNIETWAMRFFAAQRPGGDDGLLAWAEVTAANRLSGEVVNRSDRPVRDAWVVFRWDRAAIGEIAPHSTNRFELALHARGSDAVGLCPNCRRYHVRRDAFADRAGATNMPPDVKALAQSCGELLSGNAQPVVLGLDAVPPPLLGVDAAPETVRRDSRRLVAAQVAMRWTGQEPVPDGFAYPLTLPEHTVGRAGLDDEWAKALGRVELAYIPHAFVARAALAALKPGARPGPEGTESDRLADAEAAGAPQLFALPAAGASGEVAVLWDMGKPDPDEPATEAVLEALNWDTGAWAELGRAATGDRRLVIPDRRAFVLRPWPVVALRVRPATAPDEGRTGSRVWPAYLNVTVGPEGDSHAP